MTQQQSSNQHSGVGWALEELAPAKIDDVVSACCFAFGVTREELVGPSRFKSIANARRVAYYLSRELSRLSYPELGRVFHRDHTAVIMGVRSCGRAMVTEPALGRVVDRLRQEIIARVAENVAAE